MRAPTIAPTAYVLVVAAFASILLVLLATGALLRLEAERARAQVAEILDNAVPSVVAAARLEDLVLSFPSAASLTDADDERQFASAVERFRAVLARQRAATTFFPGERRQLDVINEAFGRYLAAERATRAAPVARQRIDGERARLAAACDRFGDINRGGLDAARVVLEDVAAQESAVQSAGFAAAALVALAWAIFLTRAIARPLAVLARQIGAITERDAAEAASLGRLVPREILAVGLELERAGGVLRTAAEAREAVSRQLAASLSREQALNEDLASNNAALDRQVTRQTADLAESNRKLTALVAELHALARSKATFYAAISHDLRTPVAVIKGGALTLASLGPQLEPAAADRLLADIVSEADDLARLVEDLLDAARLDADSFGLATEPDVDVGALLAAVVSAIRPLFEEQDLRLDVVVLDALPLVEADPARLRQALRNVLENAAKFSPAGTTVRVAAAVERDASTPRVVFSVADEGPGIAAGLRELLFRPFVKGEHARGGTGLGLSIARQLLEHHGGGIEVAANAQGGSTFRMWIPVAESRNLTK